MPVFPENISSENFNSKAEKKVYDIAKKDRLFKDSNIYFFHSVRNVNTGSKKLVGETDFIYLDQDFILFIEVKGGLVKYFSDTNKWGVMGGTQEKDPFDQAYKNLYELKKRLSDNLRYNLIWGATVFFPDCNKPKEFKRQERAVYNEPIEYDPELIFDHDDFNRKSFSEIIDKCKSHFKNLVANKDANGLSKKELAQLKDRIRREKSFEIPWRDLLQSYDEKFNDYTEEQRHVLDLLRDNECSIILKGGAGTGKTWLCAQRARELDLKKASVLFLCYNKNLAEFLKNKLIQCPRINITHIHKFYSDVLGDEIKNIKHDQDYWHISLPRYVRKVFKGIEEIKKYDYLVIDEGQDFFNEYHIEAIECFIKRGLTRGNYLISMDSYNQDIYMPWDVEYFTFFQEAYNPLTVSLNLNCRNPEKVIQKAKKYTGIEETLKCKFQEDVPSSYVEFYQSDLDLHNRTTKLIMNSKIPKKNITILTYTKELCKDFLVNSPKNYYLFEGVFLEEKIAVSTIHGFKGLENHLIILVTPMPFDKNKMKEMKVLYNAMTRSKTFFVLMLHASQQSNFENFLLN